MSASAPLPPPDRASRLLAAVVRARAAVLVVYAVLVPLAAAFAARIPSQGALDRLMVPSDPDFAATRAFQRIFPESESVLLLFQADDPWSKEAIARLDRARAELAKVPHVGSFSVLDALRRARPEASLAELRALALGTRVFRQQALVGDGFLTVVAGLDVHGAAERDAALTGIDEALRRSDAGEVRKVGAPYVSSWLERASSAATARAFPLFGVLLVGIALFLFRSLRALLAIVLALAAAVALGLAAGGLLGFTFTVVSSIVPLTVLVTALATVVYLHARYVDRPPDLPLEQHHVAALRNKLLPVTASTVAAAIGFAALAVSSIRPVREMGIWTALGVVISWVVALTLFPALQRVLRTPTRPRPATADAPAAATAGPRGGILQAIPRMSYRLRWPLVVGSVAASAAGAVALFGLPGAIPGMSVRVDSLTYLDPASPVRQDLAWFREHVTDLNVARVWIHLPAPSATDPEVLRAVDRLEDAIEAIPDVTGVTGPTTPLRVRRHLAGQGEALPRDAEGFAAASADLEALLLSEPDLRGFIDVNGLADLQITVLFRHGDAAGYRALAERVRAAWDATAAAGPALAGAEMRVVGEALLQNKLGESLVPTLAESFVITVVLLFSVFLVVFRSGVERLLALIPSLTALLATFLGMRLAGVPLNLATIIIATTVLGATENDQIHFFHHMHERAGRPMEERMRHALHVSGGAIVYATLINAAGFLGLAASSFPPLRQFGVMTAAAFLLALLADFTALPAALWIASGERPAPPPGSC
ncbi:MAG TPA: MMPL family transporter [Anaeromyxobacteraceae bacterium]|nr:MMPL family transporter [Anaeromyxobacteraceae bacterium]